MPVCAALCGRRRQRTVTRSRPGHALEPDAPRMVHTMRTADTVVENLIAASPVPASLETGAVPGAAFHSRHIRSRAARSGHPR